MSPSKNGFFKRNGFSLLLVAALGVYIVVAGRTGSCSACSAITGMIGLNPASEDTVPSGVELASWSVRTLEGDTLASDALKGKVVLLDFWATWCPPCRREIPGFIELQDRYGPDGLVVVGVSLDDAGPEVVEAFAEKTGINYPLAMGNREVLKAAGGVEALPTTLVIDREGRLIERHVGYTTKERFEKDIQPLL